MTATLTSHLVAFDERRLDPLTNLGTLGAAGNATATGTRRLVNTGRSAFVRLPGGAASITGDILTVPDAANLRITGDLDIVFRVDADDWTPASLSAFGGKDNLTTGRGYAMTLNTLGRLALTWSPLGTDAAAVTRTSTVSVPFADGQAGWVRATLDVDNGAGGHDVRFFTAPDQEAEPTSWTQLGTTVTTAGVTSIFATTQPFAVGYARSASVNFAGNVRRAIVRNGIGGTVVLDVNTSVLSDEGATSFTATTGQTVTINRATGTGYKTEIVLPGSASRVFNGTSDFLQIAADPLGAFVSVASAGTITTPNVAGFAVAGDITLVAEATPTAAGNVWTGAGTQSLVANAAVGIGGYMLYTDNLGMLTVLWIEQGTLAQRTATATVAVPAGRRFVAATVDVDNGAAGRTARFFHSTDGTTWTQLGANVVQAGVTSIQAPTSSLFVGTNVGSAIRFQGRMHRAWVANGIGAGGLPGGTVVADWAAFGYAAGATAYTGSLGNVWTLAGTSVVNANPLNFRSTDSFTVWALVRQWNTPTSAARYVDKWGSGSEAGWTLAAFGTAGAVQAYIDDGPNAAARFGIQSLAIGSLTHVGMVVDRSAQTLVSAINGTLSATTGTSSVGALSNVRPVRAGRDPNNANTQHFRLYAWGVYPGALTAAQLAGIRASLVSTTPSAREREVDIRVIHRGIVVSTPDRDINIATPSRTMEISA